MADQPRLLFISPVFLFPTDTGGRIRTTNVLRGMKGGRFHITLASPATPGQASRHQAEIDAVCDRFVSWPDHKIGVRSKLWSIAALPSALPVSVASDRSGAALRTVARLLAEPPDLVVADFIHAAGLLPKGFGTAQGPASVMFTHNVEAEIFQRHVQYARSPLMRLLWQDQYRKMLRFEGETLQRFDTVIAVSDRDLQQFQARHAIRQGAAIPTAVDLDYFAYTPKPLAEPPRPGTGLVFTGSMDWRANIDAMEYFIAEIWPLIAAARPDATLTVVGRKVPEQLVARTRSQALPIRFTGFVPDVRPYVQAADAYIIPLRVGGGTRIKVYEAMAMGCPVVSTSIGVEGLPVEDNEHYLCADTP